MARIVVLKQAEFQKEHQQYLGMLKNSHTKAEDAKRFLERAEGMKIFCAEVNFGLHRKEEAKKEFHGLFKIDELLVLIREAELPAKAVIVAEASKQYQQTYKTISSALKPASFPLFSFYSPTEVELKEETIKGYQVSLNRLKLILEEAEIYASSKECKTFGGYLVEIQKLNKQLFDKMPERIAFKDKIQTFLTQFHECKLGIEKTLNSKSPELNLEKLFAEEKLLNCYHREFDTLLEQERGDLAFFDLLEPTQEQVDLYAALEVLDHFLKRLQVLRRELLDEKSLPKLLFEGVPDPGGIVDLYYGNRGL